MYAKKDLKAIVYFIVDILCFKVADSSPVFRAKDFTVIKSRASHKMNQVHLWEAQDFITVRS